MQRFVAVVLSVSIVALAGVGIAWWDANATTDREPPPCRAAPAHEHHVSHLIAAHRAFIGPGLRIGDDACIS